MEEKSRTYKHIGTGECDDRDGWIGSYDPEELVMRSKSAEEAFAEDVGKTLIEV